MFGELQQGRSCSDDFTGGEDLRLFSIYLNQLGYSTVTVGLAASRVLGKRIDVSQSAP
jgi:hypothetical protein